MAYQVRASRVEWNPTAARLRELTEEMPNAAVTEFGNVAVKARVDSRSTRSTYLVEDSILQPRRLYARQGRAGEHDAMAARLKRERREFLGSFHGLDESLVKSMG